MSSFRWAPGIRFLVVFLFVSVFGSAASGVAYGAEPQPQLEPVPTAISGTLSPFTLALDGHSLLEKKTGVDEVTVNARALPVNTGQNRPFFGTVSADKLAISYKTRSKTRSLPEITLPRLVSVRVEPGTRELLFEAERAEHWLIDGEALEISGAEVHWTPPGGETWFHASHVIELSTSDRKLTRSYNLRFQEEEKKSALNRVELSSGLSVAQGPPSVSLGYRVLWESQWRLGLSLAYMPDPVINNIGAEARLSRQIFPRWLETGALVRALFLRADFAALLGEEPVPPPPPSTSLQIGPYLRSDFARIGKVGIFAAADGIFPIAGNAVMNPDVDFWVGLSWKL